MRLMKARYLMGAAALLTLSACSQEKVCEMGAKAYGQNAENIAKVEAKIAANPADESARSMLEKLKGNQANLVGQLKQANCAGVVESATAPAPAAILGEGVFKAADGRNITAVYRADQTVTLSLPDGSTHVLKQAVSGSGIRFTAGDLEWIEHQGEGFLSRGESEIFSGKIEKRTP